MNKDYLITQVQLAGQSESRLSLLFRQHLATKAKLPPTDLECLEIIVSKRQTTPGALARETGLSTGAMTAALNRLESKEFITRTHSREDRRKVYVKPVSKNVQEIYALYEPFVTEATALLASYSAEQLEVIHQHYCAMAAIYEAQVKK